MLQIKSLDEYQGVKDHNTFCNIDESLYHSLPPLGHSALCQYELSHAHYLAYRNQAYTETPQMKLGTAIHCALLEPDKFDVAYTINPHDSKRTKAYKDWLATETRVVLDQDEFDKVVKIASVIKTHHDLNIFFENGEPELVGLSTCKDTDVKKKARFDYIHRSKNIFVDLKTTSKRVGSRAFQHSLIDYNYITQLAYYADIAKDITNQNFQGMIVAIETIEPFGVLAFVPDEETLEFGRKKYKKYLKMHKQSILNKNQMGYNTPIRTYRAPQYLLNSEFDE